MTGNEHDALDAAQETFLSAFRKAPGFEGRARFSTWIYRVAINACLDLHRKKTRAPMPLEEVAPADAEPDIADVVIERGALAKALRELGEDFREAVLMHDVGGIPYEAIARATGVSVGTVKSRISRGRRKLASALTSMTSEEQARAGRPSEQRT
jgi:RNA polymerase sigma-70 factor (ECF subfamily)